MTSAQPKSWNCAVSLSQDRQVTSGSFDALAAAIRRGADLRLYTEFKHEEHISPGSATPGINDAHNHGMIRESIDFREVLLLNDQHVAGITVLRQPLEPTTGFNGTTPKLSFFAYNMNGEQAHANIALGLESFPTTGEHRPAAGDPTMPKMRWQESFDLGTAAPSRNFVYDFDMYRFFVRDEWEQVLSHDENGNVLEGSLDQLEQAQIDCREFKVAISGLCGEAGNTASHEVFCSVGSGFFHTARRFHETLTHPIVRIKPAVPLRFESGNWDLSWVALRTDGQATIRRLDPYTRQHTDHKTRLACRWFAR